METGQPCLGCGAQEEFYKSESFSPDPLCFSILIDFLVVQISALLHQITISYPPIQQQPHKILY